MNQTQLPPSVSEALEILDRVAGLDDDPIEAFTAVGVLRAALAALAQQEQGVPDGVWEALQRLIENGGSMGPASQEDAILVAQYRDRVRFMTPQSPQPAPVGEREAFERWCGPFSELRRSDFDPGKYCHSGISLAWGAWQARAALQSPAPQTKGQP